VINPIIYAEVSVGFQTIEALNAALPSLIMKERNFLGRLDFWRANASSITAKEAARAQHLCRISI
jgi:hypothetical protein